MKKLMTLAAIAASAAIPMAANAASSITIDSVQQRWPWNNKVDITYTVTDGQNRAGGIYAGINFAITIPGYSTQIVSGNSLAASAETGGPGSRQYTVTWTAPSGVKATSCSITATLFPTNVPSGNDYMIIDLASGAIIYEGLMATQDESNTRYNTTEYKSTKMVLRKVPKWADANTLPNYDTLAALGGYPTGDNVNYPTYDPERTWQPNKDYYAGVFLVTQAQYTNLGLTNPSSNKTDGGCPVEQVSWNELRDSTLIPNPVPPSATGGFLARLNYRTLMKSGISGFDLPSFMMGEIAARAGSTTVYAGNSNTADPDYIVCSENSGGKTAVVGSRLPNNWGLYDTTGNVWEWALDESRTNLSQATDALKPIYTGGSWVRYRAGRAWSTAAANHKVSDGCDVANANTNPANKYNWIGFRVFYIAQ